jgi:cytochrome P450
LPLISISKRQNRVLERSFKRDEGRPDTDGDEHKAHQDIVNNWFKPGNVRNLQERIDDLARRYVDVMADLGGYCDFATSPCIFPFRHQYHRCWVVVPQLA